MSESGKVLPGSVLHPETGSFQPDPARVKALLERNLDYRATKVREFPSGEQLPCQLLVKDERDRFGMTSFKAAGGIYAVLRLVGKLWYEKTGEVLAPADYQDPAIREFARSVTFICASAGNHGLAVTRGAGLAGAAARVYLSESVPAAFENRLRAGGAKVVRVGKNYEESMAAAELAAEASDGLLLADASWAGYSEPPALVMEGYTILADELRAHFATSGGWPARVYLQAGVGGLAAAMAHMIRRDWPVQPEIVVVEPDAAPCLGKSIADGNAVRVEGPVSSMGRLDCKVPSLLAMQVLARAADRFMVVSDEQAEDARVGLGRLGVDTSPSGGAGYAGLMCDSERPASEDRVLVLVTEAAI